MPPPKNKWQVNHGYEDHRPVCRLRADGNPMSEADCIQVASSLLAHVNTMRIFRESNAKARKQHAEDMAVEETAIDLGRKR